MRLARNVSFAILTVLVAVLMSGQVAAGGWVDGPFCDDPDKDQVTFTAVGDCSEAQSDCYDACYECYSIFPKFVSVDDCNAGHQLYGATCTCHLEEGK